MASFVDFTHSNEILKIYRPQQSMKKVPRQWWRYAILSTLHQVRQSKNIDIWKLVSEKNEFIYDQLLAELPPIAIRNKKELDALRIEVDMLRKENETLRKMLNDALEPSVRAIPPEERGFQSFGDYSGNVKIGGSVTDRVRGFTEIEDYNDFNRMISRTTTNNSTIPTVDLEDDNTDENDSIGLIQHEHSSLSIKLRSLNEGSSESTALYPSPYNGPYESPYRKAQRLSTIKRSMAENNRLINRTPRGGKHSSPNEAVQSSDDYGHIEHSVNVVTEADKSTVEMPIQRYRRPTNIQQTLQRSSMAHVQRIMKAAEIIMEKVEEELPFSTKYENSALDTSLVDHSGRKDPPLVKLPIDEKPLTREERAQRAQSVYSPRDRPATLNSCEQRRASPKHRRSPSPRTKCSPSRRLNKSNEDNIQETVYPTVTPNLSPSQKVAIEIIKEVRFKGRRSNSPVANRPLSRTEMTLLRSPFAKPLLSPRDREAISPRTNFTAGKLKKGKVHDEMAVSRVQTSKSK